MGIKTFLTNLFHSAPATKAEAELEKLGDLAYQYIKTNGLQDLIAIAETALTSATSGTSFAAVIATVESQAVTAGVTVAKGAASVVVASVQADLVAAGKIAAPVIGVPVSNPVTPTSS